MAHLFVSLIVAWVVLNAFYLFEGTFKQLKDFEFCSEALGGRGANVMSPGNRFSESWLGNVPVPVPKNYLAGIDYLKHEVEQKKWSFLDGQWKYGSWSSYYIRAILYKTPEPTLLAAAISLVVFLVSLFVRKLPSQALTMLLMLTIPGVTIFAAVTYEGGFNHHHRYILPVYPTIFVFAANWTTFLRFQRRTQIAATILAAISAISSLANAPHFLSYFNTCSGGSANGWKRLSFSNIDWGQDLLEVDKWLKETNVRGPLVMDLDYFASNGELFGIVTTAPPRLPRDASIDEVQQLLTESQWWIVSVKKLYNQPGQIGLEYLQSVTPFKKLGNVYNVYRVEPLTTRSEVAPSSITNQPEK